MKKSELKDGMVIHLRNKTTFQVISNCERLYSSDTILLDLGDFFENLNSTLNIDKDIMRITYMGEELWKRKEYLTFDEARKSGKLFKHKDWFTRYYNVRGVMDVMIKSSAKIEEINRILDEKVWELGEN